MPVYKIVRVILEEDYRIRVLLENGQYLTYNMKPRLATARFQELTDREVFLSGCVTDARRICWRTGAELSIDEIMLYADVGEEV